MISKTRKANWFEKFYWFISSENFLVVGGRDQQQNELLVKRYLSPGDLYVHADLHGASSVIIKNNSSKDEIPPKTLNEAGTMAICYSAAWEARVVTSAWWVHHNQVSKTAPSGEYLTTGSFMIRGKKNYLPPSHLVMGFSVMFKLDESSIVNHINDRKVRKLEDDAISMISEVELNNEDENEVELIEDEDDNEQVDGAISPTNADHAEQEKIKEDEIDPPESPEVDDDQITSDSDIKNDSPPETPLKQDTDKDLIQENSQQSTSGGEPNGEGKKEEEEEEEFEYPDTNIQLQHVGGDVFQLQRGESTYSNDGKPREQQNEDDKQEQRNNENRKPHISKKQRRDMKKQKKQLASNENNENNDEIDGEPESSPTLTSTADVKIEDKADLPIEEKKTKGPPQQQPVPLKRGQKKKLKKIQGKYKDQDEDDRQLMQQILKSAGTDRPPKKKGKNKSSKNSTGGTTKQQQMNKIKKSNLIATDILHLEEADVLPNNADDAADVSNKNNANNEEEDDDNELPDNENTNILNSLTGQPHADDILLYAITVCSPYSCMNSYKYKVKVTPGTGKRGRAAKSAVHMFLQAKESVEWEKDLLKSLKDVDISRNMPGKVKISAPNMQRVKKKK